MSVRIQVKILLVTLLVAAATFGAYLLADNRETIHVAHYGLGRTPPIAIGEIKKSDNAYVHLKLRFRADSTDGYPNLFQTAPANRGIRMEINGATVGINFPDSAVQGGLKGLTLTTVLKTGKWYTLEVEALNGAYVRAELDGHNVAYYASAGISFDASRILVGGGFNASRIFRGEIENISVTKGNLLAQAFLYLICLELLVGISFLAESIWGDRKAATLLDYLKQVNWIAFTSIAMVIITCGVTLSTAYLFPIYPDEIQIRFNHSRLPYDFPNIISGAPTCLSTYLLPIPATMYLPSLIDWAIHGWLTTIPALRQVGVLVAVLWIAGLGFYLNTRARNSLVQGHVLSGSSSQRLYIAGFIIAIFSIGVFPIFLVTNRNEQLILPSVVLLTSTFLISSHPDYKGYLRQKIGLLVVYFVTVSLVIYGHPKGLFLTPLFIVVGWQLCDHFKSRLPLVFTMALLALHIAQAFFTWKYTYQCSEVPEFEAQLKSFSFDPASLFYDPVNFFDQAYHSLLRFPKYLHQLGFQAQADASYLPWLPLDSMEIFANIFIKLNIAAIFFALLVFLPLQYYRKDVVAGRFVTINLALLVLFACTLISATFNLPKNWYDAGYVYALLLIILIFLIGENFSGIFQKPAAQKLFLYLGAVALLSQAEFIQRNLSAFMDGYAGPGISIASYDSNKTSNELAAASRACDIDPVHSKKIVVDDYTYLYFRKSKWPMPISYIWALPDDKSRRQFFSKVDSDGLVARCTGALSPYMSVVKREGEVCCIPKAELKNLLSLP